MVEPHTTIRIIARLSAVGALVLALGACAQTPRPAEAGGPERLQRAMVLATEAERAQQRGEFQRAVELNREALQNNDDLAGAWNNLGVCLMQVNNNVDAAEALKTAGALDPTDPRPFENLGVLYSKAGWAEEAIRHFDTALQRSPSSPVAIRGYVQSAHHLLKSDERTLEIAKRGIVIETDPKWRDYLNNQRLRIEQDLRTQRRPASSG